MSHKMSERTQQSAATAPSPPVSKLEKVDGVNPSNGSGQKIANGNGQKIANGNGQKRPSLFCRFANQTARLSGTPMSFMLAFGIIVVWGITGPLFGFSDTWQLVINTSTTIVTFLMVFLIQNTQNRDSEALHLKIDELIRVTKGAQNRMLDLEDLAQDELDNFKQRFLELAQQASEERIDDIEALLEEESDVQDEHAPENRVTKS